MQTQGLGLFEGGKVVTCVVLTLCSNRSRKIDCDVSWILFSKSRVEWVCFFSRLFSLSLFFICLFFPITFSRSSLLSHLVTVFNKCFNTKSTKMFKTFSRV